MRRQRDRHTYNYMRVGNLAILIIQTTKPRRPNIIPHQIFLLYGIPYPAFTSAMLINHTYNVLEPHFSHAYQPYLQCTRAFRVKLALVSQESLGTRLTTSIIYGTSSSRILRAEGVNVRSKVAGLLGNPGSLTKFSWNWKFVIARFFFAIITVPQYHSRCRSAHDCTWISVATVGLLQCMLMWRERNETRRLIWTSLSVSWT